MKGSIEAAVERALKAADADPAIPRDRVARMALLRRGFIPWLAGIDPDTGAPRRRVARLSEIPAEARPLIQHLVEQRLLATDVNKDTGEATSNRRTRRYCGNGACWRDGSPRMPRCSPCWKASSAPAATGRQTIGSAWLAHATDRLARPSGSRRGPTWPPTWSRQIGTTSPRAARPRPMQSAARGCCRSPPILARCRHHRFGRLDESGNDRGAMALADSERPFVAANIWPYMLNLGQERTLEGPGDSFWECIHGTGKDLCPEMVVIPAGTFMMGAAPADKNVPVARGMHQDTSAPCQMSHDREAAGGFQRRTDV